MRIIKLFNINTGLSIWAAWATLLAALLLGGCENGGREPPSWQISGETMGTRYHLTLPGEVPEGDQQRLQREVESALELVDAQMSTYRQDSALSRFNASLSSDWVEVPAPLALVVGQALAFSRLSGGAFDVTVGPLVNLWGFGPAARGETLPTAAEIGAAKTRVGFRHLAVLDQPPSIRKAIPQLYVDLSAIAKGYAVDQMAQLLEAAGWEDYLVEIGGEVRTLGKNADGEAWRVAIEQPVPGARAIQRVVPLSGAALATSGDYRNFFEIDGQRYAHAIDPRSGKPVAHSLASVSVIADTTAAADALATALLVLGPEAGWELAQKEELAALFISRTDDGFAVRATKSFPQTDQAEPGNIMLN